MLHVSNKCMLGVALCHLLVAARPESLAVIVTSPLSRTWHIRWAWPSVPRGCLQAGTLSRDFPSVADVYLSFKPAVFARRALAFTLHPKFARIFALAQFLVAKLVISK
jgi:hypothetical protein